MRTSAGTSGGGRRSAQAEWPGKKAAAEVPAKSGTILGRRPAETGGAGAGTPVTPAGSLPGVLGADGSAAGVEASGRGVRKDRAAARLPEKGTSGAFTAKGMREAFLPGIGAMRRVNPGVPKKGAEEGTGNRSGAFLPINKADYGRPGKGLRAGAGGTGPHGRGILSEFAKKAGAEIIHSWDIEKMLRLLQP